MPDRLDQPWFQNHYWQKGYNTQLTPEQEKAFRFWLAEQSQRLGRDLALDLMTYDLRGQWLAEQAPQFTPGQHGPDTYKKPNHPTFSEESIYSGAETPYGPIPGGKWLPDDSFQPSPEMMNGLLSTLQELMQYMQWAEPNTKIRRPK